MRNKIIYLILFNAAFIIGCDSNNVSVATKSTVLKTEQAILLTAPNGDKLANTVDDLKNNISQRVYERFGNSISFDIDGVSYLTFENFPDAYIAKIDIRTIGGEIYSHYQTNFPVIDLGGDKHIGDLSRTREGVGISVDCIGYCGRKSPPEGCPSSSGCLLSIQTYTLNGIAGNGINISCGCYSTNDYTKNDYTCPEFTENTCRVVMK